MKNLLRRQNGAALLITLVIIVLLMSLGVSTLNTGMVDLKIASNTWQTMESMQKAEAGISATISLIGTANDPFDGSGSANPFSRLSRSTNPLVDLASEVSVSTAIVVGNGPCGRSLVAMSNNLVTCEYYQINSIHTAPNNTGVSTTINQGIRKEIIVR